MMNPIPAGCTLQMYRKQYAAPEHYKSLRTYAIIGYVLCGLNLLLVFLGNIFGIVDVIVWMALLLGVHLGRSKGCAIALMVYSVVSMILGLILSGSLGGWLWLILGYGFTSTFKKIDKDYQDYLQSQRTGYYPMG